jgi:hypothetical protein
MTEEQKREAIEAIREYAASSRRVMKSLSVIGEACEEIGEDALGHMTDGILGEVMVARSNVLFLLTQVSSPKPKPAPQPEEP